MGAMFLDQELLHLWPLSRSEGQDFRGATRSHFQAGGLLGCRGTTGGCAGQSASTVTAAGRTDTLAKVWERNRAQAPTFS